MAVWHISPQKLPTADEKLVAGLYNGTVFILGAYWKPKQLTTYEPETDTLTDHGPNALPQEITGGDAQYWTQVEHIIYMIDANNPQFNIYNMITRQYTTNWNSIVFDIEVGGTACLASDAEYLYITGGEYSDNTDHNKLQIMKISTKQWQSEALSSMRQPRREKHACIVHKDYLWIFGGEDGDNVVATNERIFTTDIAHNQWEFIESLTIALNNIRAAAWFDTIYVIGGDVDIVHLVDVNTATVTVSEDKLPSGLVNRRGAPIIVDAVLYVFGGFQGADNDKRTSDWAYFSLKVTDSPSQSPTVIETSYVTIISPTAVPSNAPTLVPSNVLSTIPTAAPIDTVTDTALQTNSPTSVPSNAPYVIPTAAPIDTAFSTTTIAADELRTTESMTETKETNGPSYTHGDESMLVLYIAGSIASFCVCCCCVLIIWKKVTQKRWDPEPHETAGGDTHLNEEVVRQHVAPYVDEVDDESENKTQRNKDDNEKPEPDEGEVDTIVPDASIDESIERGVISTKGGVFTIEMEHNSVEKVVEDKSDDEELWNHDINEDTVTAGTTGNGDEGKEICGECGLRKYGKMHESLALFRCNDC